VAQALNIKRPKNLGDLLYFKIAFKVANPIPAGKPNNQNPSFNLSLLKSTFAKTKIKSTFAKTLISQLDWQSPT